MRHFLVAQVLNSCTAADSGEGAILPTWTSVDTNNVKTSRELYSDLKKDGWNVDVSKYSDCIPVYRSLEYPIVS